ncbi:MAG: radical SAM protein [bacterium]
MSLNAVHVVVSYRCTDACHHCFVFSGAHQRATFSLGRLRSFLDQVRRVPSVRWVYFEGGEPFLFYPMLLEAVSHATQLGLATCVVTNGYWITSERDVGIYLRPLVAAGLKRLQISVDKLHRYKRLEHMQSQLMEQCRNHRLTCQFLGVEVPEANAEPTETREGRPVTGGEVMFRGRAASYLAEDQALWQWDSFDECPHELLDDPMRVHVDPHGYVHLCQGIIIGNVDGENLDAILASFEPQTHPIVGPLVRGGPAGFVQEYGLEHQEGYADACHLCYSCRAQLLERFPEELGPPSVYGLREPRRRQSKPPDPKPENSAANENKPPDPEPNG